MIFTGVLVLGTLLSSTKAASLRNLMEGTLGEAFLATAKNYTQNTTYITAESKSGYLSSEMEVASIGPLADAASLLCTQHGYITSESSSGNDTVTTSYSLECRITSAKFDVFENAIITLVKEAQDENSTYSYSTNSYASGFGVSDPAAQKAQQKALENLLVQANTVEEVILVFTAWQSLVSNYGGVTDEASSSFSVSLNQKYDYGYPDYPYPYPIYITNAPAPAPVPVPIAVAPPVPVNAPLSTSCSVDKFMGECTHNKDCKSLYSLESGIVCKKKEGGVCYCNGNKICGCQ